MSKKYVIDLPDDAQYILINGASENHCYTRVEQVDDLEELNSDYINEHFGELQDEAYQRGFEDGKKSVSEPDRIEVGDEVKAQFGTARRHILLRTALQAKGKDSSTVKNGRRRWQTS